MRDLSLIGSTIAGIEIEAHVGVGVNGSVWRGFDRANNRIVALKLMHPALLSDSHARARFLHIVRIAGTLEHPHILRVYDALQFQHQGQNRELFVMDWAEGQSVESLVQERKGEGLDETTAVTIALACARALAFAHRRGVVHENVKPANIIATDDLYRITLGDFGTSGLVDGTQHIEFPAPEASEGVRDERSDIFALGCTLYYMIYGKRPTSESGRLAMPSRKSSTTTTTRKPLLPRLLRSMCAENPRDRRSLPSVIAAFEHLLGFTPATGTGVSEVLGSAQQAVLPRPEANAFIGRQPEIAAIDRARAEKCRLITLLGAGGIGKTRLALEFMHRRASAPLAKPTFFASLRTATSAAEVRHAIGEALGLGAEARTSAQRIAAMLETEAKTLLVIDNAEQVVAELAELLNELLANTASAAFLVNSRESLNIDGEQQITLAPLNTQGEARKLFLERIGEWQTQGEPWDDANRRALETLLEHLSGIPLAIELAAAKAQEATPIELLASFEDEQREWLDPLERTIAWSWRRLSKAEVFALVQLSTFLSGFTLEAAEAVVELPDDCEDEPILDLLEMLVSKSLLVSHSPRERGGEVRFSMLEPLADFAKVRAKRLLTHAEQNALDRRHADYFVPFAAEIKQESSGGYKASALLALREEIPNLLAVHRRFLKTDLRLSLRALLTIDRCLIQDGRAALVADAYGKAFAEFLSQPFPSISLLSMMAKALAVRALALSLYGQPEEGLEVVNTGEAMLANAASMSQSQKRPLLFDLARARAVLLYALGQGQEGLDKQASFAALAESDEERAAVDLAHANMLLLLQRIREALPYLDRAASGFEAAHDDHTLARVINSQGIVMAQLGEYQKALDCFAKVRSIASAHHDSDLYSKGLSNSASTYCVLGDHPKARTAYQQVAEMARAAGDLRGQAIALGGLGEVELELGALENAERGLRQCIAVAGVAKANHVAAYFHFGLAQTLLLGALECADLAPRKAGLEEALAALVPIESGESLFKPQGMPEEGMVRAAMAVIHQELAALADGDNKAMHHSEAKRLLVLAKAGRERFDAALRDDPFRHKTFDSWLARLAKL